MMPWDFALILLVLAVLVPWRGAAKMRQVLARESLDTAQRLSLYASTIAFQWVAVVVIFWRAHARGIDLPQLGITLPDPLLVAAVAAGLTLLIITNQVLGLRRIASLPSARQGFLFQMASKVLPQNAVESLAFLALVITVSVCEEFVYRGFAFAAISRLANGSVPIGIICSSLLFAVAHAYQGRRGIVLTFAVGLLFAGARVWTGSLVPSVAAHFCADAVAGLYAPRALRRRSL